RQSSGAEARLSRIGTGLRPSSRRPDRSDFPTLVGRQLCPCRPPSPPWQPTFSACTARNLALLYEIPDPAGTWTLGRAVLPAVARRCRRTVLRTMESIYAAPRGFPRR